MQLDLNSPSAEMSQFQAILKLADSPSLPPAATAPCATTGKFLTLFEEITGWKVEFIESKQSLRRRETLHSKSEPIEGRFEITDMSPNWPAKKPTCHRAKCDELMSLVEQLVGQLQTTQKNLKRAQAALIAVDPAEKSNGQNQIDHFVPKFSSESKRIDSVGGSVSACSDLATDDDFEAEQFLGDSAFSLVAPPFVGWSFGGATGIAGEYYLNWTVDEEERISLVAGRIDSKIEGARIATLTIDPLTQEYRFVSSEVPMSPSNDFTFFYLWSERTESLHPIESGETWSNLLPDESIVATTNGAMRELDTLKYFNCRHLTEAGVQKVGYQESNLSDCNLSLFECSQNSLTSAASIKAAELATFFRQTAGNAHPLLVLKRD